MAAVLACLFLRLGAVMGLSQVRNATSPLEPEAVGEVRNATSPLEPEAVGEARNATPPLETVIKVASREAGSSTSPFFAALNGALKEARNATPPSEAVPKVAWKEARNATPPPEAVPKVAWKEAAWRAKQVLAAANAELAMVEAAGRHRSVVQVALNKTTLAANASKAARKLEKRRLRREARRRARRAVRLAAKANSSSGAATGASGDVIAAADSGAADAVTVGAEANSSSGAAETASVDLDTIPADGNATGATQVGAEADVLSDVGADFTSEQNFAADAGANASESSGDLGNSSGFGVTSKDEESEAGREAEETLPPKNATWNITISMTNGTGSDVVVFKAGTATLDELQAMMDTDGMLGKTFVEHSRRLIGRARTEVGLNATGESSADDAGGSEQQDQLGKPVLVGIFIMFVVGCGLLVDPGRKAMAL